MNTTECPACGKQHEILKVINELFVIVCPIMFDPIFLNQIVASNQLRREIKLRFLGRE